MTYEEADNEARDILAAISVNGERWRFTAWGRGPRAYAIPDDDRIIGSYVCVVSLLSPRHPTTGERANNIIMITDDNLGPKDSIAAEVNEAIDTIRRMMEDARALSKQR